MTDLEIKILWAICEVGTLIVIGWFMLKYLKRIVEALEGENDGKK